MVKYNKNTEYRNTWYTKVSGCLKDSFRIFLEPLDILLLNKGNFIYLIIHFLIYLTTLLPSVLLNSLIYLVKSSKIFNGSYLSCTLWLELMKFLGKIIKILLKIMNMIIAIKNRNKSSFT